MVIIYSLLSAIDYIVYSLAGSMFRLIIDIANVPFFQSNQIRDISNRIYIVIGVLMLFKLVISAVQYMINPDAFDDKDKGIGGILKKTAISLGLIVLVPAIFNFLIAMQKPIIESIPNIIFGTEKSVDVTDDKTGTNLAFQVLSSFVQVREGHESKISSSDKISDLPSFRDHILSGCPSVSVFGLFGSYDDCHYNYIIIVSTVCGVFLCYILFAMILDVAIRTIKFGIIQILAPIPISSYVFSKDKLNKFAKTAMTVYLDLFVRMLIIYFILFAIQNVIDSGIIKDLSDGGDLWRGLLVNVAIIFGLLMFAKNAPKFITDLLGLQDVTSGDMKDMFTRAGALAGATGAMFTAGVSNFAANRDKGIGTRLRSAVAGASSAGFRGTRAALNGKNMKDAFSVGHEGAKQARLNRALDREQGIKFKDRMMARVNEFAGVPTAGNLAKDRLEALERTEKNIANTKALDVKLLDKYGSRVNANVGKAQRYISDIGNDLGHVINEQIARNSTWNAAAHSGFQNLIRSTSDTTQRANLQNIQTRMSAGVTTASDIEYLRANFSGGDLDNILASGTSKVDSKLISWQQAMTTGQAVSYNDIRSLQTMAENDSSGLMSTIAVKLSNSSESMRQIQKEQFGRIERDEVVDMSGVKNSELTNDPDYKAQQRQNRIDLERDSINLRGVDGAHTKEELIQKMEQDIAGFGTSVTSEIAATREKVYTDSEARAKESINRRKSNSQQNSGKK